MGKRPTQKKKIVRIDGVEQTYAVVDNLPSDNRDTQASAMADFSGQDFFNALEDDNLADMERAQNIHEASEGYPDPASAANASSPFDENYSGDDDYNSAMQELEEMRGVDRVTEILDMPNVAQVSIAQEGIVKLHYSNGDTSSRHTSDAFDHFVEDTTDEAGISETESAARGFELFEQSKEFDKGIETLRSKGVETLAFKDGKVTAGYGNGTAVTMDKSDLFNYL